MPHTVKISFDGLFVFVHRIPPETRRLIVLMADTKSPHPSHHHHPGKHPAHDSWIKVGAQGRRPFAGHLDLNTIGLVGGAETIRCALPLSRTTGEFVPEKILTGAFATVATRISGRVVLPLPSAVKPVTSVKVKWEKAPGVFEDIEPAMSGHIELTYKIIGPVRIPGFAEVNDDVEIAFTHLPPGSVILPHPHNAELEHSHMHSPIFNDKAPSFRTREPFTPPPVDTAHGFNPEAIAGGDPVICTSGNGCPPEKPDCGEG